MLLSSLEEGHDRPGVVTVGPDALSRHQLRSEALALAAAMPDDGPVAVHATSTLGTIRAVVACLLTGRVVVPVPPDAGPTERAHILMDSGATTWVGPEVDDVVLPHLDPGASISRAEAEVVSREIESTAMTLYTSGTTGPPKGVELSFRSLQAGLDALSDAWSWTPDDIVVHGLPLFHTHGLILGVLGSLRVGSPFRHTVKGHPDAYARTPGTMYFGVPTIWNRIVGDDAACASLRGARLLVSGSAPLPTALFDSLAERTGQRPVERYGMTETMITLSARADGPRRAGWVGSPVLGAQARVVGEDGAAVAADGQSIGSLQVRGSMLFSGYLNLPATTAESWTADGWFVTGDVAAHDEEGFHRIVGRESTDLVKSGGYRIGTGEVEAALLECAEVREVVVAGLPDEDLGQRLVAFVVPSGADDPNVAARLIDHVATTLSWHKRPREVVFIDALPRNAMGKVVKTQLR